MNSTHMKNEKKKSKGGKATQEEIALLKKEGFIKVSGGVNICPRCGLPIDYVRKDVREGKDGVHIYYYAIHYLGTDGKGKPKLKQCYLGALAYDYVERLHHMGLKGFATESGKIDTQREINYLKELVDKLISEGKLSAYDVIYILDKIGANLDKVILDEDDKAEIIAKLQELMEKVKALKVSE